MWRTWISGYMRALGTAFSSLWRALSGRASLLFGLLLVLVLAALFLLGTEQGRVALTRGAFGLAEKLLPELRIQARDIGSDHLGAWYFSRLQVDYAGEMLARARDLALDVDLPGLLRNRVDIKTIEAAELVFNVDTLHRLPQAPPEEKPQTAAPLSLPAVRVGSLRIDRLQILSEALPDMPVLAITGSGRYQWRGEPARLRLRLRGLDAAALRMNLDGRETEQGHYTIEFSAREKAGGFVGRQLQLPGGEALDARGRIALWQPAQNRLLLNIEEFSLPLVQHRFALSGRAAVVLSPWKIASDALLLQVDDSRHRISGSVDAKHVDAEIQFNRLPVAISQPWQDYLVGGWLSADLSLHGPLSANGKAVLPSISGTVDLNSRFRFSREKPQQPLRLQARLQSSDQVIRIQSATLDYADTRLQAAGSVNIDASSLDLAGEIHQLNLDDIRRLLPLIPGADAVGIPADLSGSVDQLKLWVKGPWNNPALSATLEADPVYRQLHSHLSVAVEGNLKALQVPRLRLHSEALDISGGGSVNIEAESLQLQLQVKARDFRPARQLGLAAAGEGVIDLDATLNVGGPWANPQLDAEILSDGSYRGYRYTLRGGASGKLEKITLRQLRLELFRDPLLPGPMPGGPQPIYVEKGSPVSPLLPQPQPSSSPPQPQPQSQPQSQQGQGAVAKLEWEAQSLGRLGVAWLQLDGVVEARAGRAEGRLAGRNIPLALAELAGVELPPTLTGEISIDGEFSGPFTRPDASATILALGEFRAEPWQLQGQIGYGNGSVDLSGVELLWGAANRLVAEGSLNPQQLDLQLHGEASLADIAPGLSADIARQGRVTLSASAAGSPRQPQLEGELRITSDGRATPLRLLLDWHSDERDLLLSLSAQRGSQQAVDARARLALAPILELVFKTRGEGETMPPLPLDFAGSGQADLSALAAFIDPEIHAMQGQLDFSLGAAGTFSDPRLQGRIQLQNGDYEHRPSNTRLRHIDLLATLTPARWQIERARADDGEGGSIRLGGSVLFPSAAPPQLDLELRADTIRLLNTPAVRGAVSGDLALTGSSEAARLAGSLTLRPLSVQIEQLMGGSVPEIDVVEVQVDGPQVQQAPPLLRQMALDIAVILDKQSRVRGLGLDSQLRGQVDIGGTAAKPQASGELRIVRGSFDLLGKEFELQEGVVQFENNKAAIYVKGLYQHSEGEITAEISGTTDNPEITFSSVPEAAQDEIFARLLFGKSLEDISPLQAVRMVSVVRSLQSGTAMFDPVASTRELLGVDTLDIDQESTDEGDQYALSLGKYITNRIYIELERSTDPLNPWQAEMQIELRHNLNVEIKSADEGDSGAGSVELQWKKDY